MFGWLGFIGRLLEFTATKLLGHHIELTVDKKKRACRDLLIVHDLLLELEAFAIYCIGVLEPVADGTKSRLYSPWVRALDKHARLLSTNFFEKTEALTRALAILDPTLARLFARVSTAKLQRGHSFSPSVSKSLQHRILRTEPIGTYIEFSIPKVDPVRTLEESYSLLADRQLDRDPTFGPFSYESPATTDVLATILEEGGVDLVVLEPEDLPSIRKLCSDLRQHAANLRATQEAFSAFISKQFTLEDLLYSGRE